MGKRWAQWGRTVRDRDARVVTELAEAGRRVVFCSRVGSTYEVGGKGRLGLGVTQVVVEVKAQQRNRPPREQVDGVPEPLKHHVNHVSIMQHLMRLDGPGRKVAEPRSQAEGPRDLDEATPTTKKRRRTMKPTNSFTSTTKAFPP